MSPIKSPFFITFGSPQMENCITSCQRGSPSSPLPTPNCCVKCVRPARSDVPCPAWISDQTMDLLLLAEKTPSTKKAFISRPGLIPDPRRDGREANEYRGGNMSLCAPHRRVRAIFTYTYAVFGLMHQQIRARIYTARSQRLVSPGCWSAG